LIRGNSGTLYLVRSRNRRSIIGGFWLDAFEFGQDLVRALLRDQHPDLADLELRDVDGVWDNQQWRLGDELAVRPPRSPAAIGAWSRYSTTAVGTEKRRGADALGLLSPDLSSLGRRAS